MSLQFQADDLGRSLAIGEALQCALRSAGPQRLADSQKSTVSLLMKSGSEICCKVGMCSMKPYVSAGEKSCDGLSINLVQQAQGQPSPVRSAMVSEPCVRRLPGIGLHPTREGRPVQALKVW